MRGISAERIASFGKALTLDFWSCNKPVQQGHGKFESFPCPQCDYFVSHCWPAPCDWDDHFVRGDEKTRAYEYKKVLQLNSTLKLIQRQEINGCPQSSEKTVRWEDLICWVDKACIPQDDAEAKMASISLIEEFIKQSNGLIVLLAWNYFSRLWCVYEWACFLVLHHPLNVEIGLDAFLKHRPDETLPLFIQSIEDISVQKCQCFKEDDRSILEGKVFHYYQGDTKSESFSSFERFAKYTAISLMAKEIIVWRASADEAAELAWLQPLRDLASRLGFSHLHQALQAARPAIWFKQCHRVGNEFNDVFNEWNVQVVVPLLFAERDRAVRHEISGPSIPTEISSPICYAGASPESSNNATNTSPPGFLPHETSIIQH